MNSPPPIPRFVFAYVTRAPRSVEDLKRPAIARQLNLIDQYLIKTGRAKGPLFPAMPTYRKRTFVDHPAFEKAVAYACDHEVPLLVGDLDDLLSQIPPDQFVGFEDRLRILKVEVLDARTGNSLRGFSTSKWAQLHGMAVKRKRSALAISAGRQRGRKPANINGSKKLTGAIANRRRAERQAESIRPIVDEMEAALASGQKLSPSALMHRLNELGIKGPKAATWSRMATTRYLRALRQAEAP